MTHPIVLAAKAAYGELTNEEAKAFFKSTAISHTLLVAFYCMEAVYWTVEAGRLMRTFVDSFSTPEEAPTAPVVIAGLLCPAKESPITTQAIATNQQKLEQHITQTLRDKYNVQSNQESDEVGSQSSGQATVEPLQEPVPSEAHSHPQATKAVSTRPRKPRAASGDTGKAKTKTPSGRVPQSRGTVSQK
jgi:hypothetical protein